MTYRLWTMCTCTQGRVMVSWPVTCNIRIYTVWGKPRRASEKRAVFQRVIWTWNFVKGSSSANHITRDPGYRGCMSHAVSCVSACTFANNAMPTCASRHIFHCLHVWIVLAFVTVQSLAARYVSSLYKTCDIGVTNVVMCPWVRLRFFFEVKLRFTSFVL